MDCATYCKCVGVRSGAQFCISGYFFAEAITAAQEESLIYRERRGNKD